MISLTSKEWVDLTRRSTTLLNLLYGYKYLIDQLRIAWLWHYYIPTKCPGGLWKFHRDDLFTGISHFSRGYSARNIFIEVWRWRGMLNLWPRFPAGKIFYRGYPRWLIFSPGWKPARQLPGMCYVFFSLYWETFEKLFDLQFTKILISMEPYRGPKCFL